jgi:hypothetical protein
MSQKPTRRTRGARKAAAERSRGEWQDIEDMLAIINPPAAKRRECWPIAIAAVRMVHAVDPDPPPGKLKSQLEAIATASKKLDTALMGLPDNRRRSLLTPWHDDALKWLTEMCRDQADKIEVKRHSGGRPGERHDTRRKQTAFRCAFELLYRYDPKAKGERFYKLAGLIFKAATGRAGDCKPACVGLLRALRAAKPLKPAATRNLATDKI